MSRRPLAAVAALALLSVAGCGGSEEDARESLEQALSKPGLEGLQSGIIDASFDANLEGEGSGGLEAQLTGPFAPGRAELELELSGESVIGDNLDFSGGATVTPDNLYLRSGDRVYELGAERFAQIEEVSRASQSASFTGGFAEQCRIGVRQAGGDPAVCDEIDPSSWLEDVSDEGTEEIAGVDTEHASAELDAEALFGDLFKVGLESAPAPDRQALQGLNPQRLVGLIGDVIKEARVDTYRGVDDGLTRRIGFAMEFEAEGESLGMNFELTLSEVNEPQTIAAPTGPVQPVEALRGVIPPQFQPAFDCFLAARTTIDFSRCGTQIGTGAP